MRSRLHRGKPALLITPSPACRQRSADRAGRQPLAGRSLARFGRELPIFSCVALSVALWPTLPGRGVMHLAL
jgi:hypothetical protein